MTPKQWCAHAPFPQALTCSSDERICLRRGSPSVLRARFGSARSRPVLGAAPPHPEPPPQLVLSSRARPTSEQPELPRRRSLKRDDARFGGHARGAERRSLAGAAHGASGALEARERRSAPTLSPSGPTDRWARKVGLPP